MLLLYSRVMDLFDTVERNPHQCAMDDLYKSSAFFKAAYNHEKKVQTCGVANKLIIGIPQCITLD